MPAARAAASREGGTGPPPSSTQRSPSTRSRPASSSRCRVVATRLTSATGLAQGLQRGVELEAVVDDGGGRVDRGAHQDREAAHVRERHHAQPALLGGSPEGHGRAEGAPQQVAVGELDLLRLGARAGGVHHQGGRVEVVAVACSVTGGRVGARRGRVAQRSPAAGSGSRTAKPQLRSTRSCSDSARRRSIGTTGAPRSRHACNARAKSEPAGSAIPTRVPRATPCAFELRRAAAGIRVELPVRERPLGRLQRRDARVAAPAARAGHPSTTIAHRLASPA